MILKNVRVQLIAKEVIKVAKLNAFKQNYGTHNKRNTCLHLTNLR